MPSPILGGMQVFLYSTICVAGFRVLSLINYSRRNRFILTASFGIGFIDIVKPNWFSKVLDYNGGNLSLQGFEEGVNLIVETPFIIAGFVGVFLNLVLPRDRVQLRKGNRRVMAMEDMGCTAAGHGELQQHQPDGQLLPMAMPGRRLD